MRLGLILLIPTALASSCLPDAVAPGQRQDLTNAAGESYPIGLVLGTWNSAYLTSAIFEILAEEVMGYNTRVEERQVSSSAQGMYATLGCATWYDAEDRGCSNRKIRIHMQVDSWWLAFAELAASVKEQYKAEAPVNGGSMGWLGESGMYVPGSILEATWAQGEAMEYYRSYDARWHEPWKYFDNISKIENISEECLPCSETLLWENSSTFRYVELTGDNAGVVVSGTPPSYVPNCEDGRTWKSPSCRSNPLHCIIYITGGDGWGVHQGMQRATFYNIPMLLGVASSWSKYLEYPSRFVGLMYWWTPDDSFLDIAPKPFVLPPPNKIAWEQGDFSASSEHLEVTKIISSDLEFMAPDFVKLLRNSPMQLEEINSMMQDWKNNASASRHDIACQWLLNNPQRWQSWIPDPTACNRGYGLYNEGSASFTSARASATTCRACPPGMYSVPFSDNSGATYVCEACPAGTQQPTAGAVECVPCPTGTSKAEVSVDDCTPCLAGFYQDEEGGFTCKQCPAGTTTLLLGTKSGLGCGCDEGSIDTSGDSLTGALCMGCPEGLNCPTLSTLESLKSGTSPWGPKTVPQVEEGYYTPSAEPLNSFKCMSAIDCPGGQPGTCGGERVGVPCGECPEGSYFSSGECRECSPWSMIGWIFGLVMMALGLILAYYLLNSPVTAKASTLFTTTCALGMMVSMLQSLGIIGTMTVDWPVNLSGFFTFVRIFTFDIEGLGFACVSGSNAVVRYVSTVLFFPTGVCWLVLWAFLSQLTKRKWDKVKVRSTIGQFLQVGYSTMTATALVPMVCYGHPNGQRSNIKNPNIMCGSEQHTIMLIWGYLLLVFGVCGFFSFCAYMAYMCPKFSSRGRYDIVQSLRFLLGRFRLDVWWYGVPLLLRGPLLALPVVFFPDTPALQVLCCQTILICYVSIQLLSWPWKAPVLNIVDFITCLLLAVLVMITGFYVPAVTGATLQTMQTFSAFILVGIFGVVMLMMCLAVMALFYRAAIGSQQELWIMNGGAPKPSALADELQRIIELLSNQQQEDLTSKLAALGVYDLKGLEIGLSVLNSEVLTDQALARHGSLKKSSSRVSSKAFAPKAQVDKVDSIQAVEEVEENLQGEPASEAAEKAKTTEV